MIIFVYLRRRAYWCSDIPERQDAKMSSAAGEGIAHRCVPHELASHGGALHGRAPHRCVPQGRVPHGRVPHRRAFHGYVRGKLSLASEW
jgi:hypothetical protein